jgi:hypothetical protein
MYGGEYKTGRNARRTSYQYRSHFNSNNYSSSLLVIDEYEGSEGPPAQAAPTAERRA